ncbi:D-alanyl-D-alanine carboxypeptidase/D-alanyl-D-alanine endopeptidase [Acaryochloris marina]|uniref:D-alanyl-D-alanine carboxypeptidase n=1 Tax=Acaryochloris marina (strain MBIC 11017) TaxID=329726 RepID=B0CDC7_ACAM1|nr:D-alanyl-D-alanine carboxypeptidase/D-alanyl-D-alanine-endopeptidase [Acaryochloris marina]ABW26852.1 D-alanyl-D-alanine carboxypeptidase [Acaryochloris marina MBIC11017]BDM81627.1 D-alanyl-D-alanine carboxypeptidase [Acaryochloris marina MBIC10699]
MSGDNVIKGGLVVGLLSMSVAAQGAPSLKPQCVAQLQRDMDEIASQPLFTQARLGIAVQPLQASQPLYTKDAQRYFLPASTTKVMTTAAALTRLGPQFRIQTDIYGSGTGPALDHLRIVGRGDPTLSDQQLQQIATQLKQKGIRQINHLLGDDTYFQGPGIVPSWEWEDLQAGYGAPVNSLILNQNAYELKIWPQALGQPLRVEWLSPHPIGPWRQINRTRTVAQNAPEYIEIVRRLKGNTLEIEITGQLRAGAPHDRSAVAVIDPGWFLLKRFRAILAAQQIKVGRLSLLSTPQERNAALKGKSEQRLTQIQSSPLTTLIKITNQESNNLYAEALVKALGAAQKQTSQNTHQQGLKALKQTLTQLGVNASTYAVADGSGLSRQNLVSPLALTQTLNGILKSPHASTFQTSLPKDSIGQNSPSALWSKSGGMRGVSTLTGYLQHPQSSPVLFSLMFNQYNQSSSKRRQAMDAMLLSINRWQSCQGRNG